MWVYFIFICRKVSARVASYADVFVALSFETNVGRKDRVTSQKKVCEKSKRQQYLRTSFSDSTPFWVKNVLCDGGKYNNARFSL